MPRGYANRLHRHRYGANYEVLELPPAHGTGSVSYNDTTSLGFTENYGMQSADFENTTYDWSAMSDNVTSANAAVATLMYQCGVSVCMDYNLFLGSNSNVTLYDGIVLGRGRRCGGKVCAQTALAQYFGYDSRRYAGACKEVIIPMKRGIRY